MINRTVRLFFLSLMTFSFHFSTSYADQLVAEVNGTDLNIDWSEMTEAHSYTLYYALGDFKGDIALSTLGSVEMGKAKSLYVANLPSGWIIYSAILAHTSEDDVASNIVKFMPFGGTITLPETGDVIMSVIDPGGVGNLSIVGTKNVDGSVASISQIAGDDGSGSFALNIVDDKPVSYTKGDLIVNFVYHADGTASLQTIHETQPKSFLRAVLPRSIDAIDCNQGRNEYKQSLFSNNGTVTIFTKKVFDRAQAQGFPVEIYKFVKNRLIQLIEENIKRKTNLDLFSVIVPYINTKFDAYFQLLQYSLQGIADGMLEDYEEECTTESICPAIYDPLLDNNSDNYFIIGDKSSGVYTECMYFSSGPLVSHKTCADNECVYQNFYQSGQNGDTSFFLNGLLHGSSTQYYESGQLWVKANYYNGEKHGTEIMFLENGNLQYIRNYSNGLLDGEYRHFYEGELMYCYIYNNGNKTGECY